jgi:hypothetical protein
LSAIIAIIELLSAQQSTTARCLSLHTSNNKYNNPLDLVLWNLPSTPTAKVGRSKFLTVKSMAIRERDVKAYSLHGYDFDPLQLLFVGSMMYILPSLYYRRDPLRRWHETICIWQAG